MSSLTRRLLGTALVLAILRASAALAITAFGIAGNELLTFDTTAPGTLLATTAITGLQVGESLLAIDVRPVTGQLYGLGSTSRLYVVETSTGTATQVGSTSFAVPLDRNATYFGFDFDPVADVARVVSDSGQNFRLDPESGRVIDGDPGTPGVQADSRLSGGFAVVACAYSNAYPGAATTTLYAIDAMSSALVQIGGPDGTPSPDLGTVTTFRDLPVDIASPAGLDIATNGELAYAALKTSAVSASHLYVIDLGVGGAATDLGAIGNGTFDVRDIAVVSRPATIFGVTGANELVEFGSLHPETLLSTTPIGGLPPGEQILDIDFRPANGTLFALGSTSQLYTIDPVTGGAVPVGAPFDIPLSGTNFGMDFNPVADRIRVVSDAQQNFRVNPDTGAQVDFDPNTDGLQLDTSLHSDAGTPSIVACAYTNDLPTAVKTTLYGINADDTTILSNDRLRLIGGPNAIPPPNQGLILIVGPNALGFDTSRMVGFDVAPIDGTAFASLTVSGVPGLYAIDLGSGVATFLGGIGAAAIRGIAVAPPGIFEFAAENFSALESDPAAHVTIIRVGGSAGPASVRMTASSGTATAGVDFKGVSPTVVFRDGETSKTVDVPLFDDNLVEGPESVVLTLGATTASIGPVSTAVLTIVDGDGTPTPTCNVNADCDDGDRCTTDTCASGQCSNVLTPRFETLLCELDAARRADLCGDRPIKQGLVRAIRRMIVRTGTLVERAASGKTRAAGRADGVLAGIQAKAKRAVAGTKIPRSCGRLINQRVQGLRDLLGAARATTPR